VWYLVACARRPDGLRTYRVGRIRTVTVLDEAVVRPDGFDLGRTWRELGAGFDRALRGTPVRALLPERELWRLRHALSEPSAAEAIGSAGPPDEDGRCEIQVRLESVDVAHDELLRLGAHVEVLDPPELRSRLAVTGEALARQHAGRERSLRSPA
jgi:predicted DNA-binding transcriptional regulator YafY